MSSNFFYIIELLGTFAFAVSGAFAAMQKKLDPFGVLIIAFVTAIGGGTIRDLLIGSLPVGWLSKPDLGLVIFVAVIGSMFFGRQLRLMNRLLFIFDALGLGLFTMAGLQKGIDYHLGPAVCTALGILTGCFGGVIRDVMLNNLPLIFHREIYASACVVGAVLYFLLKSWSVSPEVANVVCMVVISSVRILAFRFNWSLPKIYLKE
ncbi:MAG TPA: trimeric intracellular cation channel family protein [Puia sp.]|nr:trimeric intracellular cation channel family protein [Puia sp.]